MTDIRARINDFRRRNSEAALAAVPDTELGRLYRNALEKYSAKCFWNCAPRFTEEGLDVLTERLKKYGDLRAWYLAADIQELRDNARRPQSEILKVLAANRSPESVMAGGSVLHYHAFRLSDDQDLFHADGHDLRAEAQKDVELLRQSGFEVDYTEKYEGLLGAVVSKPDHAPTTLQWVQSGLLNFFTPVSDPEFGYRLHLADLAVKKVEAAASRKEVRDFVDLDLIHEHLMPLWHAVWAAPGKNEQFSPLSIIEVLRRKNSFSQARVDEEVVSSIEIDAAEMGRTLTAAFDEAERVFSQLPMKLAGNIFVTNNGELVNDVQKIIDGLANETIVPVGPAPNGAWPSNPDIDRALVDHLVETFGYKGSKLFEF